MSIRRILHENPVVKAELTFDDELSIVAPRTCQTAEDAAAYPPIVNHYRACPYRNALLSWMVEQTEGTLDILEFDTIESMRNAVGLGMGVTLLPDSITINDDRIRRFHVPGIKPARINLLTLGSGSKPSLLNFIGKIKDSQTDQNKP